MKAILKQMNGEGNVVLKDIAKPSIGTGDVRIGIHYAGICGTDIKILHGTTWSNPPVVLGHEYSGLVLEIGKNVENVQVGDRVVSETANSICGHCEYCMTGNYLMCEKRLSIGYGVDGAFTNEIVVRAPIVHKIPRAVSLKEAAMAEPAAVAVHACMQVRTLAPSQVVLVFGPGPIGLLVAQVAKSRGAVVCVLGVEADKERLALARDLGADYGIILSGDIKEIVKKNPILSQASVVYECSGSGAAVSMGIELLKKRGSLVQVGLTKPELTIPYAQLSAKELRIFGSFGHTYVDWDNCLSMMANKQLRVESLITHEFPLDQWEKAFETAERKTGIKVLLTPIEEDA